MTSDATKRERRAKEEAEKEARKKQTTDKFITLVKATGNPVPQIVIGDGFTRGGDMDELTGFLGRCGVFCLNAVRASNEGKLGLTAPAPTSPPTAEVVPVISDPSAAALAQAKEERLKALEQETPA